MFPLVSISPIISLGLMELPTWHYFKQACISLESDDNDLPHLCKVGNNEWAQAENSPYSNKLFEFYFNSNRHSFLWTNTWCFHLLDINNISCSIGRPHKMQHMLTKYEWPRISFLKIRPPLIFGEIQLWMRLINHSVWSVLLHGEEIWILTKTKENKSPSFENWVYSGIMRMKIF